MTDARVSPRERLVLTAIIELYIATGEPVASQSVANAFADRDGLTELVGNRVGEGMVKRTIKHHLGK